MCELFGLSSSAPTSVNLSLSRLAAHGGLTGPHRDGWGVAFYEDRDVRLIKEAEPAADSDWIRFLDHKTLRTPLAIAHIRLATEGAPSYRNTQPFARELGENMLGRVLLATDFSRHATPAETAAHMWAERHVPIDCLHVIQTQSRLAMPLWPTMAEAALSELGAGLHKVGSPVSAALLAEGEPAEQIARTAQTHNHSLVIVGKHGQNWIEGRLIGSTAARICEIAGRPVLVMP